MKYSKMLLCIPLFFIMMFGVRASTAMPAECSNIDKFSLIGVCYPNKKACATKQFSTSCYENCASNINSNLCLGCISNACGVDLTPNVSSDPEPSNNPNPTPVSPDPTQIDPIVVDPDPTEQSVCSADNQCLTCDTLEEKLSCMKEANLSCREVETSATCNSQCQDGNVFQKGWCELCLAKMCGTSSDEPSPIEPEPYTEWNFCDKHGVLVSMRVMNRIIEFGKILVPILLIIFGLIDLTKAATSGDDSALSKSVNSLIKKIIIALIIFFVPVIIKSVFGLIDDYNNLKDNGCYTCFFDAGDCDSLIENSNDD